LKALGVAIVMDDFGTGYSSLGYMLKFPFDRIKIDRSFVSALEQKNENATNVVQSIIALGHTLKMDVTAEGVETQEQSNALMALNCDDAQGYHYGRPMPAADIPALLLKNFSDKIKETEIVVPGRQTA
jgi:EAL domain-containing protein (putative c-di-GMP-specific phosphodiesterase class I)